MSAMTRGRAQAGVHAGGRQEVHAGATRLADSRLDTLTRIFNPNRVVPVEIKYWAVPAGAGTPGNGPGIGGHLLNLLQNADALMLLARAFEDPSVPHVNGGVDPHRDTMNIETELALSDLGILERRLERIQASLKGARDRERDMLLREANVLQGLKGELENDVPVREQQVLPEDREFLSNYQLLTAKPLLIVFNIGEEELPRTSQLDQELTHRYERRGAMATTVCGKLEMELSQLASDDEQEFRESMGLQQRGVDRVARASYDLLSLVSFFTFASHEVKAWTVPANTPALKAAGKIHSDMEHGFIRAEVVAFDDLERCGSLAQCKRQGLLRLEGKTYPVKDGDVITFLFNV